MPLVSDAMRGEWLHSSNNFKKLSSHIPLAVTAAKRNPHVQPSIDAGCGPKDTRRSLPDPDMFHSGNSNLARTWYIDAMLRPNRCPPASSNANMNNTRSVSSAFAAVDDSPHTLFRATTLIKHYRRLRSAFIVTDPITKP
jgi:hypothetical protein